MTLLLEPQNMKTKILEDEHSNLAGVGEHFFLQKDPSPLLNRIKNGGIYKHRLGLPWWLSG